MKLSAAIWSAVLLLTASALGGEPVMDWVKVTDQAGWRPRDSSGEVGLYRLSPWQLDFPWFSEAHS